MATEIADCEGAAIFDLPWSNLFLFKIPVKSARGLKLESSYRGMNCELLCPFLSLSLGGQLLKSIRQWAGLLSIAFSGSTTGSWQRDKPTGDTISPNDTGHVPQD